MAPHRFTKRRNILVDSLKRGHLDDLVYQLLDGRPGIRRDLLRVDHTAVARHVLDQRQRLVFSIDADIIVGLLGDLGHLGCGYGANVAYQQLGSVDVNDLVYPW